MACKPTVLFLLLGLSCSALSQTDPGRRAEQLADELAKLGFPINLDCVKLVVVPAESCAQDLLVQQLFYSPPAYFRAISLLRGAFGLFVGRNANQLREAAARDMARSVQAYYQADQKRVKIKRDALSRLGKLDALLAHELVHAWQDQSFGLVEFLGGGKLSLEETAVRSCLLEGEADLVSLQLTLQREGRDLSQLTVGDLDASLQRIMLGEARSLPYELGRTLLFFRFREGGWPLVKAMFSAPPASTEQIMHLEKLGTDPSTLVSFPDRLPPGDFETELGELEIYKLLLESGLPPLKAGITACGWDGDRYRAYLGPDSVQAFVWRTVWDRSEDGEDLFSLLKTRDSSTFGVSDDKRVIDWVWSPSADVREELAAELRASRHSPHLDSAAATTTERAEATLRERSRAQSVVRDGWWEVPAHGLRILVPDGWKKVSRNGMEILTAGLTGKFDDNLSVLSLPRGGATLEQIRDSTVEQLRASPNLVLDRVEELALEDKTPALILTYHGKVQPTIPVLRFSQLVFLRQDKQMIVTATVSVHRWDSVRESIDRSLHSVGMLGE